jgi:hypothetical protein
LSGAEQRLIGEAIEQPLPPHRIESWRTRPGLYRARVGELWLMLRLEPDDTFCLLLAGRRNAADRFARDYQPSRQVQAIPLEESLMASMNASNNTGAGAGQTVPTVIPEPKVAFQQLKALYDAVAAIVRAETAQSDGMLLEHRDALAATALTLEEFGARIAGVAEATRRLELGQKHAVALALDTGLAPVVAQVAELRTELASASARATSLEAEHCAVQAQLRSELDCIQNGVSAIDDSVLAMAEQQAARNAELSACSDAAVSKLRDEFSGRIDAVRDELAVRIDDGLSGLDRLANDVVQLTAELRGELGALSARFDAARAELAQRDGRSWASRLARRYARLRTRCRAVVARFRDRCGTPRPAADQ